MRNLFFSFILLFVCQLVIAQTTYLIAPENGVKISVKGSSTLHEWEAVASEVLGYPAVISTDLKDSTGLENFAFKVRVESLDGGRGTSMNKKINKALLSADHPYIIFNASDVEAILSDDEESTQLKSIGVVEIAGEQMEIEVNATVKMADNTLILSGSKDLKMSDFGIEPPTAMFGQIKTREDITVHFEFRYIADQ